MNAEAGGAPLGCTPMAFFATADEVYEHLGKLLSESLADGELGPALRKADGVVQYQHRSPEATITLDLRAEGEPRVDCGATELVPEVVIALEADTAHRLWLGRLNVPVALAGAELRAKGPVAKILRLVALVEPLSERYRAQLEGAGREDLAKV